MSSFWLTLKQQWTIKISSPLFSIFSLAAILVGSQDHRTQFWKGAIQGPFHQSLVAIGPVVSEEKIKMWNVDGRMTDDGRRTKSDDNSSHGLKARWAKKDKRTNNDLQNTENYRSSSMTPTNKTRDELKCFLLHEWHQSCYCCQKFWLWVMNENRTGL